MKYKKLLAIAMAVSIVCASPAFAAVATGGKPKAVTVSETAKKVYTYDEVLAKSIANSTALTLSDLTMDLNEKKATYASQSLGGLVYPQTVNQYSQIDSFSKLMEINELGTNTKGERYAKEATKLGIESAVKTAMSTIVTDEAALKLKDTTLAVYNEKYRVAKLKNSLGMATDTDVTTALAEVEAYEADVETTKNELSNAYTTLARLMGVRDTNFAIKYEVEYTPYVLDEELSAYIARSNSINPDLQKARIALETMIANKNFTLMADTTPYGSDSINYNISNTQMTLKNAEDGFKSAIEDTYKRMIKLEGDIKTDETNLENAKTALKIAELNLSLGRGTQLDVDNAKVKVQTLINTIESLKYSHENMKFSFENPCVLG
ncbi:MAG: TolC family protein [Lachnospiraceae bacterium]|nr:TolC family protein [Lachnospiraceae bacterium]